MIPEINMNKNNCNNSINDRDGVIKFHSDASEKATTRNTAKAIAGAIAPSLNSRPKREKTNDHKIPYMRKKKIVVTAKGMAEDVNVIEPACLVKILIAISRNPMVRPKTAPI
jgi:hypothetical protein